MTAALYIRVSTQEQSAHGLSVDAQKTALIECCEKNGYQYRLYADEGISAHISHKKRPALMRMIADCQSGLIDVILMTKLDRFFRSVQEYYAVMEKIGKVPWRTIWEDYETETSQGVFKVNIMLSVAQAEAERTSERIRQVNDYRINRGEFVGGVPIGYKFTDTRPKNLVKDPETEGYMNILFSTFRTTLSSTKAAQAVTDAGFPMCQRYAYNILKNEIYTGHHQNAVYEPYITDEEYEKNQSIMAVRRRTRGSEHERYLFTSLILCPYCGRKMRAKYTSFRKNGEVVKKYNTYECIHDEVPNPQFPSISVAERRIEKALIKAVISTISEPMPKGEELHIGAKKTDYNAKKSQIEGRLSRLKVLFEYGDIEADEYRKKRDDLRRTLEELKPKKAVSLNLPPNWEDMYQELDRDHRYNFWHSIIKSIEFNAKDNRLEDIPISVTYL